MEEQLEPLHPRHQYQRTATAFLIHGAQMGNALWKVKPRWTGPCDSPTTRTSQEEPVRKWTSL